jgi:hypothetical protein
MFGLIQDNMVWCTILRNRANFSLTDQQRFAISPLEFEFISDLRHNRKGGVEKNETTGNSMRSYNMFAFLRDLSCGGGV